MEKRQAVLEDIRLDQERIKSQVKLQIQSTQVIFPHEPYPIQKEFMQSLINSLDRQQNALLQSPTGTGKTLSLLCATLGWLKKRRAANKKESPAVRIVYLTRTHSQIKQVISELKKTVYLPNIVVSASRDHACCNKQLISLQGHLKELECRKRISKENNKTCVYSKQQQSYPEIMPKVTSKIRDLEELVEFGEAQMFCPFYYSRKIKEMVDILFIPYNYLLDKNVASLYNISTQNCILIFDEGHNVIGTAQQCNSYTISTGILQAAIEQLSVLKQSMLLEGRSITKNTKVSKDPEKSELKSNLSSVELVLSGVKQLQELIKKSQTSFIKEDDIQEGVRISFNTFYDTLIYPLKIQPIYPDYQTKITQILADMKFMNNWAIDSWLIFIKETISIRLQESDERFQVGKKISEKYNVHIKVDGSNTILTVMCLDAALGFRHLIQKGNQPYNIVITSGTLSPLNTWSMELRIPFPKPLACPHILKDEQVHGRIINKGPYGQQLQFSFDNRSNKKLYQELGWVLLELFRIIPSGVIVLFSSYGLLETCKKEFKEQNLINKMYNLRKIFIEDKNSVAFKDILNGYLNACKEKKGAVLLAVTKGKISEGMDFSDDKCRAIILVGVPYPSIKDKKIESKKQFLDKSPEIGLSGNQWYLAETLRTINQSIGRVIRNLNDYGGIFLIDTRFNKPEILNNLSEWIKNRIVSATKWESVVVETEKFFKDKMVKIQPKQEMKSKMVRETEGMKPGFSIQNIHHRVEGSLVSHLGSSLNNNISLSQNISRISSNRMVEQAQDTVGRNSGLKNMLMDMRKDQLTRIQKMQETRETNDSMKRLINEQKQKDIFAKVKMVIPVADDMDKYRTDFLEKQQNIEKQECPVCNVQTKLVKNKACSHALCQVCWDKWLECKLSCPICRERVRKPYLLH